METSLKLIEAYERAGLSDNPVYGTVLFNASFVYMKLNDLVRARECAERSHAIFSSLYGPDDSRTKKVQIHLQKIQELEQKNPDFRATLSDSRLCSNCNKVKCLFCCAC